MAKYIQSSPTNCQANLTKSVKGTRRQSEEIACRAGFWFPRGSGHELICELTDRKNAKFVLQDKMCMRLTLQRKPESKNTTLWHCSYKNEGSYFSLMLREKKNSPKAKSRYVETLSFFTQKSVRTVSGEKFWCQRSKGFSESPKSIVLTSLDILCTYLMLNGHL